MVLTWEVKPFVLISMYLSIQQNHEKIECLIIKYTTQEGSKSNGESLIKMTNRGLNFEKCSYPESKIQLIFKQSFTHNAVKLSSLFISGMPLSIFRNKNVETDIYFFFFGFYMRKLERLREKE